MSSLVAPLALTAALGEDRQFAGTHQVSDHDQSPVNITGWTIVMTIKNPLAVTVTINGSIVNATAGTYTCTVASTDTVTLGVGDCAVDVWRTNAGAATLMALGTFSITKEVRV